MRPTLRRSASASTPSAGLAARPARQGGQRLDGVVCCSAQEACDAALRMRPGIQAGDTRASVRPGTAAHDQARVDDPEAAIAGGADYLVIGARRSPQAADPVQRSARINTSLGRSPREDHDDRHRLRRTRQRRVPGRGRQRRARASTSMPRKIDMLQGGGVPIHEPGTATT